MTSRTNQSTWGLRPQTPGIYRIEARMALARGGDCRPGAIPAPESALGLRPRSALSSAQVLPEWTMTTLPSNDLSANGNNPLNFVSHLRGSVQFEPLAPLNNVETRWAIAPHAFSFPAFVLRFLRIDSPCSSMRWALCTRRSRVESAMVGSPICACQEETGSWLVSRIERA